MSPKSVPCWSETSCTAADSAARRVMSSVPMPAWEALVRDALYGDRMATGPGLPLGDAAVAWLRPRPEAIAALWALYLLGGVPGIYPAVQDFLRELDVWESR